VTGCGRVKLLEIVYYNLLCRADEPSSVDDDFGESADSDNTDDWNVGRRGSSRNKPSRFSTRSRRPKRFNDFGKDFYLLF